MTVIQRDDAPVFDDVPGATFTGHAAPSRGASEVSLWTFELAAGTTSQLHHMDCEELLLAQSGAAVAVVDGVEHDVGPGCEGPKHAVGTGACLVVATGAEFSFGVGEAEPFRAVAAMRAGGLAVMD